jgi:S1-C subfamily serine protease
MQIALTIGQRIVRAPLAIALAGFLACGTAFAQPAQQASSSQAAATADQNSVKLVKLLMALPAGSPWMSMKVGGLICIGNPTVQTWPGGREEQKISPYSIPFKTELERAGYKVVTPGEDNLFEEAAGAADYDVAAVITDAHVDGCMANGVFLTERGAVRGDASLKMDWQLYSRLKKQVVARVSTSGTAKLEEAAPGGVARLITEAFASNVRELAQSADFRAAMSAPRAFAKGSVLPDPQSKIALLGSLKAPARRIDEAVGSVVTLSTGLGTGSGFLVSQDGSILTNAHVVGDDKEVRVRWSDGIETLAQVMRVAKGRDVAIIKTNPRDRTPLAIKRGAVTPGQRVYAIGSPLGQMLQGTVSSGIISANRVIDGMRFIQSDTTISHGSSGGPLVDETGSVIGISTMGYLNDGPAGLNMFIPIGDAMDFLALEQH